MLVKLLNFIIANSKTTKTGTQLLTVEAVNYLNQYFLCHEKNYNSFTFNVFYISNNGPIANKYWNKRRVQ